jgi:hypothetical protein
MTDPIEDLRRELVSAARREIARGDASAHGGLHRGGRRHGGRRVAILALVLIAVSGTGVAASQLFGSRVRPGAVVLGGPEPKSVVLSPLRVADLGSEFPWGVRTYTPRDGASGTSGGASGTVPLRCAQVGHVAGDQLGVIGVDGAFGNDGQFHALPVEPLTDCVRAAGFVAYPGLIPDSAYTGDGSCTPPGKADARVHGTGHRCALDQLRLVVYGVAPSGATRVRLTTSSATLTERLVRAGRGAFLFVLPAETQSSNPRLLRLTFGHGPA